MFVTKNSKKPDPVFQIDHRIDVEIVIDNNKRVQMFVSRIQSVSIGVDLWSDHDSYRRQQRKREIGKGE